jgi:hypothetical protein
LGVVKVRNVESRFVLVEWGLGHDRVGVIVERSEVVLEACLKCDVSHATVGFQTCEQVANRGAVHLNVFRFGVLLDPRRHEHNFRLEPRKCGDDLVRVEKVRFDVMHTSRKSFCSARKTVDFPPSLHQLRGNDLTRDSGNTHDECPAG